MPQGGSGAERTLRRRRGRTVRHRGRADQRSPSFRGRRPWNPPVRGRAVQQQWTRESYCLLRHPREAGIPSSGAAKYVVATCTNQWWDSRAERENDVQELELRRGVRWWTREGHCLHRHPRAAGIPYGGAGQCVVVTLVEPSVGFFACCAGSE